MAEKDLSLTVIKATALLRIIGRAGRDLDFGDIVRASAMPKTVCYRLLHTLESEGLVERDADSGRFRIGPGLVELAGSAIGRNALRNQANRKLAELARITGDAVLLFIPYGRHAMCIDRFDGDCPVKPAGVEIGGLLPIHCGGAPFTILSHLPEGEVEAILAEPLAPMTARTLTDPALVRAHMAEVRAKGYAVGDEDAIEYVVAIGAPIFGSNRQILGALSIGGIKPRFGAERIGEIAALVRKAAGELTQSLGHARPATADERRAANRGHDSRG